jgi:hypothetical protein
VLHYLGTLGINSASINARYGHVQTPIDHFKEYQVAAFVYEMRSTAIKYEHIDTDFYAAEDVNASGTPRPDSQGAPPGAHHVSGPTQTFSSISLIGAVVPVSAASHKVAGLGLGPELKKSGSGNALSSMSSTFSLLNPGISPRPVRRPSSSISLHDPLAQSLSSLGSIPSGLNNSLLTSTTSASSLSSNTHTLTQAKLSCTLDALFRLLLIMSAQKKHHISRLVVGGFYHSSVPIGRNHSPAMVSPRYIDTGDDCCENYSHLLGAPPLTSDDSKNTNMLYYTRLEKLLSLRDTLQELLSTQRQNTALDNTANKMVSKLRVLKNSIEHTSRQSSCAIAGLTEKTTLRSTQRRVQEEAALLPLGRSRGDSGHVWQTAKDLHSFFHNNSEETPVGSRSSSVLRDSVSTDLDNQRLLSEDSSVGHHLPELL